MEYTLSDAEHEASAEFGSLALKDSDGATITLLTPLWLDDPQKVARIRAHQKEIESFNDVPESDKLDELTAFKTSIVDMLSECADKPDRLRTQLMARPLPVALQVMRKWQEAGQPGEAARPQT